MTFKPVRFFVLMALLVFLVCGAVAFFTQRAAHGHTPVERAAYEAGAAAGSEAPSGAKLPYASDMNEMAQKAFDQQGGKAEPMTWKSPTASVAMTRSRRLIPGVRLEGVMDFRGVCSGGRVARKDLVVRDLSHLRERSSGRHTRRYAKV